MKSNLLKEMQQLFDKQREGNNIPIPSYVFVQRYGRDIQDDMREIADLLGQREWFSFSCTGVKNDEKLVTGFQIELERHSGIGKEYEGSVLVEFSGKEEENQLEEMLDYIYSQKHRLHCIYTVKDSESVKYIKELLDRYGFVRIVKGEEYEVSEQIEIFMNTLEKYHYGIEAEGKDFIGGFFGKQKWQEEEAVSIRIQNMAKELVYNRLLEEEQENVVIRKDEVEKVIHSLQSGKPGKRQMGFVMGGAEVE